MNGATCPTPITRRERITLGHGSGGRLSAQLIGQVFLPVLAGETMARLEDQAVVPPLPGRLAITTDSFVVQPLFFPGGNIGHLAVHGTVNDLAVGGAVPRYLTCSFILEEGLAIADLERIVRSMREAADEAGVELVAGDTKVVERGKGDGVFINTTGIGQVPDGIELSARACQPGDQILVSGTLGDHGMALMCLRQGIELDTPLTSDTAPLASLAAAMLKAVPDGIRVMRDPTRGGLASCTNELAQASGVGIELDETAIPLKREVRAACEILGLDALQVACEGRLVAVVAADQADHLLSVMRDHPRGRESARVGQIVSKHAGAVTVRSSIGGKRILAMLSGEQLPRIC